MYLFPGLGDGLSNLHDQNLGDFFGAIGKMRVHPAENLDPLDHRCAGPVRLSRAGRCDSDVNVIRAAACDFPKQLAGLRGIDREAAGLSLVVAATDERVGRRVLSDAHSCSPFGLADAITIQPARLSHPPPSRLSTAAQPAHHQPGDP